MSDQKHQVGDTVYCDFSYYSRINVKAGVVVKVTPTGRVNVDFGDALRNGKPDIHQFGETGRQIGGDRYHGGRLIDSDTYERLAAKQKRQEALSALNVHIGSARISNRAQLDEFMAKLMPLADAVGDDQ